MAAMPSAPSRDIQLISAPTDVGTNIVGAHRGPQALRDAHLVAALQAQGWHLEDAGDLDGPPQPQRPPLDGYRNLDAVIAWNRTVQQAVAQALAHRRLPLLLGGDHSLAVGSLSAVARHCRATGTRLRVLWLDAHTDCNSQNTSPSANLHGMPLACLRGLGPAALTELGGGAPTLAADDVRLIGIRSMDRDEAPLVRALGLQVFDMAAVRRLGMPTVLGQALSGVDQNTHLHVSLDVDFLDPQLAPGVSTAVAHGPSLREAQQCMALIAASGRLGSVDVVELNPQRDPDQRTAPLVVDLVARMFAPSA